MRPERKPLLRLLSLPSATCGTASLCKNPSFPSSVASSFNSFTEPSSWMSWLALRKKSSAWAAAWCLLSLVCNYFLDGESGFLLFTNMSCSRMEKQCLDVDILLDIDRLLHINHAGGKIYGVLFMTWKTIWIATFATWLGGTPQVSISDSSVVRASRTTSLRHV